MRQLLDRIYQQPLFVALGRPLWWLARRPSLERTALRTGRFYGALVHGLLGPRRAPTSAGELAERWSRLMPHPRSDFPVVSDDGRTAYVEIHLHCPLRGSGDSAACWRAMSFDRELLRRMGGQLVVMQSQSTQGTCCRLAIRAAGDDVSDLPVADPRWLTG